MFSDLRDFDLLNFLKIKTLNHFDRIESCILYLNTRTQTVSKQLGLVHHLQDVHV